MRYRFYLWIAFIAWTILTLSEARKSSKKRKSNPTGLGGNQVPQETLSNSGPISHLGESGPQSPTGLTGTKRTKRQSDQREEGRQMGPPGRPGIPGPPGSLGPQGPPGLPGLKGESGDWGLPGVPGEKGTPGIPGMFGMKGEKGTLGAQGFPGEPGIDGRPGPRGFPGLPGYPGYSRDQGSEGPSDKSGPPGPPGPPGLPGLPGPQGLRGEQGYPGEYGMPGMKGEPGKRGPTGPPGPPGLPGLPAILSKINTQNDPDILVQGDQPVPKVFGNELSIHETQELLNKVLEQLKASFENNKKPNEDKKDPFKTCRDILAAHPDSGSGKYWVDPNGGDSKDWILVYCDMEKKATCVMPSPARSQEIRYVGNEPEIWLGEMEIGIQFTYKADSTQIDHLHLLSSRATQNITYHCRNSVAYYDLATQSYRKGIKLVSYNDVEITPEDSRLKYVGVVDECKYSGDSWAQSVLEFTTNKPSRLPITDVGVRDIGKSNQVFWIEIGSACFY